MPIFDILSVVAMVPQEGGHFFCVEKPGLEVYALSGGDPVHDNDNDGDGDGRDGDGDIE